MKERLQRIKNKLATAKQRKIACFGSGLQRKGRTTSGHRWESRPVPEETIAKFEQYYNITLPEEYRAFIKEIGVGAGPYYGLSDLGLGWVCDDETEEEEKTFLSDPCLIEPRMSTKDERGYYGYNGWEEELDKDKDDDWYRYFQGILEIAHQGCAYVSGIIVNGPHRGHVLGLSLDLACPIFQNPSFLDWYEAWLDRVIEVDAKPKPDPKPKTIIDRVKGLFKRD